MSTLRDRLSAGVTVFFASGLSLSVLSDGGLRVALWAYRGVELGVTRMGVG